MDYCEAPRINYFDWMQVMKAYQSSHWVPGLIHLWNFMAYDVSEIFAHLSVMVCINLFDS